VYGVNGIINDLLRDLWPRLTISKANISLGAFDLLLRRRSVGPIHFSISIPSPTPRNPHNLDVNFHHHSLKLVSNLHTNHKNSGKDVGFQPRKCAENLIFLSLSVCLRHWLIGLIHQFMYHCVDCYHIRCGRLLIILLNELDPSLSHSV